MRRIRRVGLARAVISLGFGLAACHLVPQGGMADRCADLMRQALPGADIDITKREAAATSLTTIVARVEGDRTNLPSHPPIAHHLAVECTYDNGVLTGFRWTKGPK
jgi:hypothetical protein